MTETITISDAEREKKKNKLNFLQALESCSNNKLEIRDLILKEVNNNSNIVDFIQKYFDIEKEEVFITSTSTSFNINRLKARSISSIVNLKKVNDIRFINKFFESVNIKLPNSGLFFGCVETYPNRRKVLLDKYPPIINWFIYFLDTLFTRVLPKLKVTKKIYFYLTKGKGRVISRAETYGRLYSCGFEIIDEKTIDNILYFVVRKIKEPVYDNSPSYGALIKLKRIDL